VTSRSRDLNKHGGGVNDLAPPLIDMQIELINMQIILVDLINMQMTSINMQIILICKLVTADSLAQKAPSCLP